MQKFILLIVLITVINCKTDKNKSYDKFIIDQNITKNDTIKLLSNFPEVKLFKSEIIESEPQGVFDRSVLDSLSTWKFVPGLQKGEQVAMWLTQKVRFQLD